MKITFWAADKSRETLLAAAFLKGAAEYGDTGEIRLLQARTEVANCDVACMVGVKSFKLFQAHRNAEIPVIYFDKGYVRARDPRSPDKFWEYWRVSVNAHQPADYLYRLRASPQRFDALGLTVYPWRESGNHIVFAGSSEKYHTFMGLGHPTKYAKGIIKRIAANAPGRRIVYRPKPSWHDAVPIAGTDYSAHPQRLGAVLEGAHVLVTHGSNACFEAIMAGIPCIILGDAAARPISSTSLGPAVIQAPAMVADHIRMQWLWNLAHCQWTIEEMERGDAWASVRSLVSEGKDR